MVEKRIDVIIEKTKGMARKRTEESVVLMLVVR